MKDYLSAENARNQRGHRIFERLLKCACGTDNVLVAHHLTFILEGQVPNEIPSADTIMFDHELMKVVFGDEYLKVIVQLAQEPTATRDQLLRMLMDDYVPEQINVLARA